jgi:hypothetical protein
MVLPWKAPSVHKTWQWGLYPKHSMGSRSH